MNSTLIGKIDVTKNVIAKLNVVETSTKKAATCKCRPGRKRAPIERATRSGKELPERGPSDHRKTRSISPHQENKAQSTSWNSTSAQKRRPIPSQSSCTSGASLVIGNASSSLSSVSPHAAFFFVRAGIIWARPALHFGLHRKFSVDPRSSSCAPFVA